jgi:hypothetical protein
LKSLVGAWHAWPNTAKATPPKHLPDKKRPVHKAQTSAHGPLTFMHIMAKMSLLFCPSDNMPILAVCRRPVMPYLQQQQQQG